MKVLLREDVDNLGYAGEIMSVADGYGRNYLIPRGIAVKASPNVLRAAERWRERAAVRMTELQKQHDALSKRLVETQLTFIARAGDTGKLYGSVTTADVVDKLNEVLGTEVERRQIVGGPLRQLGEHKVTVRLSRDYQPQITVIIDQFEEEIIEEEEALEAAIVDGELADVELADGELVDVELVDGELAVAELADAELVVAELADSELADGEIVAEVEEAVEEEEEQAEPESDAAEAE